MSKYIIIFISFSFYLSPCFAGSFDYHFDNAVGKFVDHTNKYVGGTPVDKNTRKVQIAAVKIMIDPRESKRSKHLDELIEGSEKMFESLPIVYKNHSSSSKRRNKDYCENKFQHFLNQIIRMRKDGQNTVYELDNYYIKILECYIERKEYNRALFWIKTCEEMKLSKNMANAWNGLWYRQVDRLEMVLKGNDDW